MKAGMRIGLLSFWLVLLGRLRSDEAQTNFSTTRAKEAQKSFEKTEERLRTEYEGKLEKARADYAKALQSALADAKKAKNKQEVEAIEKTIAEVGAAKTGAKPAKSATKPEKLCQYTFIVPIRHRGAQWIQLRENVDIDINAGSRLVPPVDGDPDEWWHWEPDHSANGR